MKYHLHAARLLLAIRPFLRVRPHGRTRRPPDTSAWKCEMCPFMQGYAAEAEAGVIGASGANATFGRYTGIDHGGAYADVSASGQYRNQDGTFANYDLENLGLDSRDGYITGGREGRYDVRISYDGQPNRLYDTGATPFRAGGSNLALPSGWVPAASTGGMSALNAKPCLSGYRIGSANGLAARPILRDSQLDGVRRVSAPGALGHESDGREFPDRGLAAASAVRRCHRYLGSGRGLGRAQRERSLELLGLMVHGQL